MADTGRIRLCNLWLNENKTWLVKLWFQIPEWYVLSVEEENKLFRYIITERENSYTARYLDCEAMCDGTLCFSPEYKIDPHYTSSKNSNEDIKR